MDEREAHRAEQEARRDMQERPVPATDDAIIRYLAAVAYAQGYPRKAAPEPEATEHAS